MRPSPTYRPPEGEEFETSVAHGLPLWAEPAVGCCSRRPRPSPIWGSCFVGARAMIASRLDGYPPTQGALPPEALRKWSTWAVGRPAWQRVTQPSAPRRARQGP